MRCFLRADEDKRSDHRSAQGLKEEREKKVFLTPDLKEGDKRRREK